jgi:hypothetical protein
VQPELGLQRDELGVPVGHRDQRPGQLAERVTRGRPVTSRRAFPARRGLEDPGDRTDPVADPRGQQLEEQPLLVREVGVQRAHRVAGRLGDLLHRRPGEAPAGEQARGRVEQPLEEAVTALPRVPARTRDEITGFFGDLTLVEPGLTDVWDWRPDGDTVTTTTDFMRILGGVARKG